ncbi:endonuclease/exonuclease/phosphatase family protein [Brachybacterium avium]|nr:endonuclease/exonuclease/phosphatase family protein [Brachybacterium avium]
MSTNIRCDRSVDGGTRPGDPDHWPERRPLLIELLARERPDLLGVQEALQGQLSALDEALPGHRRLGFGREGGSRGEHAVILYDPERFEVIAWDQFWLSDTPKVIGSVTWGHTVTRIVVRADLRDRITGRELTLLNTHLDHESETARQRAAQLLADLVANNSRPTILTGDFNAAARASRAYSSLVTDGPMLDSWDSAHERLTPAWGTFTDYLPPIADGERIDWILTTPDLTALQAAIVTAGTDVRAHSDHAAVQALLELH